MPSKITRTIYYTVDEAEKILGRGFSRSTLYRLAAEGKIPYRRPPAGGIRFAQEDIDQILADSHRPAVA